jgi:hypothetical protein
MFGEQFRIANRGADAPASGEDADGAVVCVWVTVNTCCACDAGGLLGTERCAFRVTAVVVPGSVGVAACAVTVVVECFVTATTTNPVARPRPATATIVARIFNIRVVADEA